MAEKTAPDKKIIPNGLTTSEKSAFTSIIIIPVKETKMPLKLSHESRSRNENQAATGEKRGIVAMMTEVTVDVVYINPKFSPRKYKKGLNKALMKKRG